jgi:hypothetical protein
MCIGIILASIMQLPYVPKGNVDDDVDDDVDDHLLTCIMIMIIERN